MSIHEIMHKKLNSGELLFVGGVIAIFFFGVTMAKMVGILLLFVALIAFLAAVVLLLYRMTPPNVTYIERRYIERQPEPQTVRHEHYHHLAEPAQRRIEQKPEPVKWRIETPARAMIDAKPQRMIGVANQKRLEVKR